ncbi:hypothetical protein roselon_02824 [Roseibacterium elongatum DSM 19469]|uniref:DUF2383 domain-containing protein n=1 Tax=Roseicyclus elongatus DSM 19469 TaxID=1294273 RepID=W8S4I8_9RHOB|nr:DUF2383 domain-containing protein [Roseibacterium elongatum]AHM05122.1 hypothetical protein roselon_02824 [Roseibacterium elongatum DSM 19469]
MPIDTHDPTAALSQLTTNIADIIRGYEVMEDKADVELRPVAQRLHALHEAHAAELLTVMENMGGRPEDTGSMMGAVHQAVATGRDWLGTLDASAIPQIVSGEERLLSSYDAALDTAEPRPELHKLLLHQRDTLKSQIDALKRH